MPFRARDLLETNFLIVDTYPRAVDFPVGHDNGEGASMNADIINLTDDIKRYFDFITYGFIAPNTYMPCIQKLHFQQLTHAAIITQISIYDLKYDGGEESIIDVVYLGDRTGIDVDDDVVHIRGAPWLVYTKLDVIIEDMTELVMFIPLDMNKLRGQPLAPGWTSTKITRDEVCDMPDIDNWRLTTARDWIHHHDNEHIIAVLHKNLAYINDAPHNLYKVTNAGVGYLEIEYL